MKYILTNGKTMEGTPAEIIEYQKLEVRPVVKAETVIKTKRPYHLKKKMNRWTGEELHYISQRLTTPVRTMLKDLKGRTKGAINGIRWEMRTKRLSDSKAKTLANYLRTQQ